MSFESTHAVEESPSYETGDVLEEQDMATAEESALQLDLSTATNGKNGHANGAAHAASGAAHGANRPASAYEGRLLETDEVSGGKSFVPVPTGRKPKAGQGLPFNRRFTAAGQDPFETVEWEKRTAGITGEDGNVVFEQKDCEIPATWSQLATNVVVSKYFRGPLDSPQRENSVRQMIGRVADTIARWGVEGGYFKSDEDASAFRDELAYLLLHQYGSFNSPVWFNIGVKARTQQAAACFINQVSDDMESHHGIGGDRSALVQRRLRRRHQFVAHSLLERAFVGRRHRPAGRFRFMRGWDAFAGAIKSGGTTRRAAKMVILNADHPDIEEFITCKVDEEKKAWALIEAGYNGGFNVPGGAYDSVDFQNANHSVRVTDEFMRAAENGMRLAHARRYDGKPIDNHNARDFAA